jgi:hypothetical protein
LFLLFLALTLWANQNEIENDQEKDERHEKIESASGTGGPAGRSGLRLSKEYQRCHQRSRSLSLLSSPAIF